MPDPLIANAQAFLRELAATNTRDWFAAHKHRYDTQLRLPAEALLARIAGPLADIADGPITTKLFRIHRDVRFSKDKTPYNTYLRLLWTAADCTTGPAPAFYFGIDPETARAGGGILQFDGPHLAAWRQMIDLDGDRIGGTIARLQAEGYDFIMAPELKRVPAPYSADHPLAELLRRKGIALMRPVPDGPLEQVLPEMFKSIQSLNNCIASIA